MNIPYAIDFSLQPVILDLWHVGLATIIILLLISLVVLLRVLSLTRQKEPEIKIIEVEKIVQTPIHEPIILRESTPDAALQLLGLLQKEARFIDFIKEDMTAYSDVDIGIAARVVHEGCVKAISEHFSLNPVRNEHEGDSITLPQGFDANLVRLTGNIVGTAPFTGILIHKGWQVTHVSLPKLTPGDRKSVV